MQPIPNAWRKPESDGIPVKVFRKIDNSDSFYPARYARAFVYTVSGEKPHAVCLGADDWRCFSVNPPNGVPVDAQWHYYDVDHLSDDDHFKDPRSADPLPGDLQHHFENVIKPMHDDLYHENVRVVFVSSALR